MVWKPTISGISYYCFSTAHIGALTCSRSKIVLKISEFVGFQTMVILELDLFGMTFDAVGAFGLAFWLLFKSGSSYCETYVLSIQTSLQ